MNWWKEPTKTRKQRDKIYKKTSKEYIISSLKEYYALYFKNNCILIYDEDDPLDFKCVEKPTTCYVLDGEYYNTFGNKEKTMNENISITCTVNGKEVPLSSLSDETIQKIKESENLPDVEGIELIKDKPELIEWLREHPKVYVTYRLSIEHIGRGVYLAIPLPTNLNMNWTIEAFNLAKDLYDKFKYHTRHGYFPGGGKISPNDKLYVYLGYWG